MILDAVTQLLDLPDFRVSRGHDAHSFNHHRSLGSTDGRLSPVSGWELACA